MSDIFIGTCQYIRFIVDSYMVFNKASNINS